MPRRAKPKAKKRDWRWYASFGLNGLVALSMVLGTIFLFGGGSSAFQRAAPTLEIPDIPTLAPTVSSNPIGGISPSATPQSTPAATVTPTPKP